MDVTWYLKEKALRLGVERGLGPGTIEGEVSYAEADGTEYELGYSLELAPGRSLRTVLQPCFTPRGVDMPRLVAQYSDATLERSATWAAVASASSREGSTLTIRRLWRF